MNLRYLKHPMSIFLFSLAIIVIITVIVINIRFRLEDRKISKKQRERQELVRQIIQEQSGLSLDDFLLQESPNPSGTFYPSRQPTGFWTEEETDSYWIPPSEVGLGSLDSRNDKLIFRSLGLVIPDGQP